MIPAFELTPRHRSGETGAPCRVDPAAGSLIKEERKTIVWRQTLADGTPAVMKLYRHRKPAWLERHGYYTGRAEREFLALCHLEQHQVPCSAPLFWAVGTTPEGDACELLATREVQGAMDLKEWLDRPTRPAALDLAPLFRLTAALHRSGLQHGALLARNVLLAGQDFYLIDLPRSQTFGCSIEGHGPGWFDVKVLLQSLTPFLTDDELVRGLAGYPPGSSPADALVRHMRTQPLNNRRLNLLHAVYTLQSGVSRLFCRTR